ncbi:MAG: glycoside hydrolase family 31 protein [bacterium]|nr:glycoside hydrolase family 31 protein [bacterium]
MTTLPPQFKLTQAPLPKPKSVIKIGKLRLTLLTSRLIRIEYSPDGHYEDRPSQAFWYRDQPTPTFHSGAKGDQFSLETEHLVLTYDLKQDVPEALSIFIKANAHTWHYGDAPNGNLRGTYRTLDAIDGAIPLELGLVSREGWALVDDSQTPVFNADGWLDNRQSSPTHDLYFFGHGTDYQGALNDFFAVSGRVPMIPRWALGNWWSRYWAYSDQDLLTLMDEFAKNKIPLSVCIVDMDWHITDTGGKGRGWSSGWTGYTWNTALFPNPQGFIDQLHTRKLRTALNLHPHAGVEAHEIMYEEMAKWMGINSSDETAIPFDIADPRFAQGYFEILHHPHEAIGVDFWWLDWQQEYESEKIKKLDALWWLNHLHFYDYGRDNKKRPFIFSRWGGLGNHRYPIGFSGDTHTTWESLAFQPYFTATATNVGYSWWSHDIGGHMFGVEDGELYTRWVQYGVFSPIMRLHSTKNHFSERRPWAWRSEEVTKVAGDAMRLRHQFVPYIYSMAWRNVQEGVALVNPMYYSHPTAESAYYAPQQYWFGSEMITAPYTSPIGADTGVSRQAVWLPQGDWYDFASGARYEGGGWTAIYGDLRHMPIFVKDGGIIPLADSTAENDTPLPQKMHLHRYGKAGGRFVLYEDDGETTAYLKDDYAQTVISTNPKGELSIATPTKLPAYIPQNREWVHHQHGAERDIRAECEALLWRFQMNTWMKDALGNSLTHFITDPFVLRDFVTFLTPQQIRALLETAHGVGVHHLTADMGVPEAYILWNKNAYPDFTYSYTRVDGKSGFWGNKLASEGGIVPAEKIIVPLQPIGEERLIPTHHRLRVDYFGLATLEF